MPKLKPKDMLAELAIAKDAFKKKFTPGFYHASPSNKIKEFDPTHAPSENGVSLYAGDDKANATFITRDPRFANSMLPAGNAMGYKPGSTVYPVSANLGKHFDYETPEGLSTIKNYLAKKLPMPEGEHVTENDIRQWVRDRSSDHNELKEGSWAAIEHPEFQRHLQDEGYDSFAMQEAGRKNIGIYEPHNIRGKFAEYNPDEAMNPDFMKAAGGYIPHMSGGGKYEKVVKAYKLFKTDPKKPGELFPLFVNANKSVPVGEWVNAEVGPVAASGKVKSKLGELAYRPGWHAGDLPIATHIGGKSDPKLKAPDFRRPDEVWAEVEMPNDVDWQSVANQRAELNKAGVPIARTAHITDQVPEGGHYRYKTSPNMEGNWLIGGGMKVNKVLTDEEVQAINEAAGKADLPRFSQFDKPMGTPEEGMATGGGVPPLEHGMAPQQAHVIDPGMRPPGAPIQHFGTGSAVKKVLEHARTVPFVHFSNHPNISRLEPSAYGSGIKGAEAARLKDAPDIKPRSYFYVKGDNVRPEQGLGAHQYEGVAENIYPLHEDPAGFSAKARDLARDPYFAKMGVEIIDQPKHLNELERQIKNAGYSGYADDNVGLLFNPTDVTKVTD